MPVNAVEFQFRANQTYWLLAAGGTAMRRGRLMQPRRSASSQVDVSPTSSLDLNLWVVLLFEYYKETDECSSSGF